jgi:hypothetical protein
MEKNELILKTAFGILICFLVGGFLYSRFYLDFYKKYSIRKNQQIVQGARIVKVGHSPKAYNVYIIDFAYTLDNKEYRSQIRNSYNFKKDASFLGKLFPVVIDKSNFSHAFILIKPEDFSYFDLPFPDSLHWINNDLID